MEILELVLWVIFEFVGEALLEGALDFGLTSVREALGRENRHPAVATIGYLVLGATVGGLSVWLFPQRVFPLGPIPGLSLVLNPAGAGLLMEVWGRHRRAHGHSTTNLATWYGGAALALGWSVVRFLGVR